MGWCVLWAGKYGTYFLTDRGSIAIEDIHIMSFNIRGFMKIGV